MNIDQYLAAALVHPSAPRERLQLLHQWATSLTAATVDWDRGAGESWGRVIFGGTVELFAWMQGEFAIGTGRVKCSDGNLLVLPDLRGRVLQASAEAVVRFAGRVSPALELEGVSAHDLVFATI
jgi:hypothetical protein